MALATQLSIYNGALAAIGDRQLLSLTENRSGRRALDDVWVRGGVRTCLASGLWNFATRATQWNYSPDFTPRFGYQCAFQMPADWVRAAAFCEDTYFKVPLINYSLEAGYVFADLQIIYVKWISDDPAFGMNFALWSDNFQRFVELYFASLIARRLTNSDTVEKKVMAQLKDAEQKAKSTDAMEESTMFLPPGTWSQARHGKRTASDGGSRNNLIGSLLLGMILAGSGTATLDWIPPSTNTDGSPLTNLAGYNIRYGTQNNNLSNKINVPNPGLTTFVVDNLPSGKWYFAISAYTTQGVHGLWSKHVAKII